MKNTRKEVLIEAMGEIKELIEKQKRGAIIVLLSAYYFVNFEKYYKS